MTTRTSGLLGLSIYAENVKGWGQGQNNNMKIVDSNMSGLHNIAKQRTTDIERAVASHSADILLLVQAGGADFTIKAEALKALIVLELKEFIDDLVDTHTARALANQLAAQAVITTLQTQIDALETLISDTFNSLESDINTRFSDLTVDLSTKFSSVQTMRDQLLTILTGLAQKIDLHLQDRLNPHRVTFEQSGGSAALKYLSNSDKDKRYL